QEGRLAWDLGVLEAGAERRVKGEVEPVTAGQFKTCASVTFTPHACLTTVITQARLELVKSGADTAQVGDNVVVHVRGTNLGHAPAVGVVLHDDLPSGLEHDSGATLDAEVGTLAPGESKQIKLITKATKQGRHINKASAWAENAAMVHAEAPVLVTQAALE